MKHVILISIWISLCSLQWSEAKPVSIHKQNYYLLNYNGDVFYPVGVNANGLLNLDEPDAAIQSQIKRITNAAANTIRLSIDCAVQDGLPVNENRDGTLQNSVLNRLELLCSELSKHNAIVILSILDLQRMAETWDIHPYNSKNGGDCSDLHSFFTNPQRRNRSLNRIKQVIEQLQHHENLIFELARGINLDEWKSIGDTEWRTHIHQWTNIMLDTFRRRDEQNHLTALSFLPNTTPYDMMKMALVDLSFLHIKANNSITAVKTANQILQITKSNRKPVFIGELTWTGSSNQAIRYQHLMLWSTLAAGSSALLHNGIEPVPAAIQEELKQFRFALPMFDLAGSPRPPAKNPPIIFPPDSYVLIDYITGYDWIVCILRKTPGIEPAQVAFPIQKGWFDYQWFNIEKGQLQPSQKRYNTREMLQMQTPEMDQIIIGRLRYLPDMKPPSTKANQPNQEKGIENLPE